MKCRLDGPVPEDIAYRARLHGASKVVGTSHCTLIQQAYEQMFGVVSKGSNDSGLPRRVLKRKLKEQSVAGQKRLRESQIQESKAGAVGVDDGSKKEELQKLESITEASAKKRFSKSQESYAKALQEYADAKRKQSAEDAEPPCATSSAARKLAAHQADAAKAARLQSLEKRSLSLVMDKPALPSGTIVVATESDAAGQIRGLLGDFKLWPQSSGECVLVAKAILQSRTPTVWLCSNSDQEQDMFWPDKRYSTFTACARLLGGWVGTPYWLRLAVSEGRMLQPIVQLQRGLDISHELHFDKSLEESTVPEAKALAISYQASKDAGMPTKWVVVKKAKNLILRQNLDRGLSG